MYNHRYLRGMGKYSCQVSFRQFRQFSLLAESTGMLVALVHSPSCSPAQTAESFLPVLSTVTYGAQRR